MTACGWVDWCARDGEVEVELSNRAGTEQMTVCRLHLAAARLYGYRDVGPGGVEDQGGRDHAGGDDDQGGGRGVTGG